MLSIGIDFGTSNSSVAVFDPSASLRAGPSALRLRSGQASLRAGGNSARLLPLDRRARDLPTEQNPGREVRLERRYLRDVTMVFGEDVGEVVKQAFALIDVNEPGRLFQSLKRFLPVTSFKKTNVFGTEYRLEGLGATLARERG